MVAAVVVRGPGRTACARAARAGAPRGARGARWRANAGANATGPSGWRSLATTQQRDEAAGKEAKEAGQSGRPETHVESYAILNKLRWDPESLRADKDFNRFKMMPAAALNHLCLGSIFAWSIFNQPLMRLNGVVAPAGSDWALGDVSVTFSLVMGGFVWGAVFGKHLDRLGPRASCLLGAGSLVSGFSLASAAVVTQSLPLLYLGGAVWGISNGIAYVPPVSTLVKWFPDRKGLAAGLTVVGYGGGAVVAAPLFTKLLANFRSLPEYAGPADKLDFINQDGSLFLETAAGMREVVVATAGELAACGLETAQAGAYFVGTGSTGMAETLAVLGLGYGTMMAANAFTFRLPPHGYVPPGLEADQNTDKPQVVLTTHNVSVSEATRSLQFWLLFAGFGSSITGTYGLLSSAKLMITETFASSLPTLVTAGFTTSFVAGMSAANLGGRLFWPAVSDSLARYRGGDPFYARKMTYSMMWTLTPLLYGSLVWSVHECASNPSVLPLGVFSGSVLGILSIFGGSTANRPAIVGDLYGLNSLSTLTARQLSVVLPAAFAGPQIVAHLRQSSMREAITDLSDKVDDASFHHAFGADKESLSALIDSNTVTISRLLEIIPPEAAVQDPTPFLYDQAMYILAGLQLVALGCNLSLRPLQAAAATTPAAPSSEPAAPEPPKTKTG